MRSTGAALLIMLILFNSSLFCQARVPDHNTGKIASTSLGTPGDDTSCKENSSLLLLNSLKEKDDWQIISGPAIPGIRYPVPAFYTKPFPSWEMDRYTADSSYFSNCDWMVLPDKKSVINTVSRLPIVFIKRFTTLAPSKLKLIVKLLYDNMAYLYIDSTWIKLSHHSADINRFIHKLRPELTGFVSIPALFNYSYNASFYAGDFYNLVLPAGDHIIKIELFNNAYELGCIIKGMLISEDDKKIFCSPPVKEEQAERASILLFRDEKAFTKNKTADTLYSALMHAVKLGYWIDNLLQDGGDLISSDTIFMKRGERINVAPGYITVFYNGNKDTAYAMGSLKKIADAKAIKKRWDKSFIFDAMARGNYLLEINCETPADAKRTGPNLVNKYTRVIKVN